MTLKQSKRFGENLNMSVSMVSLAKETPNKFIEAQILQVKTVLKWYVMENLKLYLGLAGNMKGVTGLVGFKLAGIKIMVPW